MLATSNFAEVGRSYKNIVRVSLGLQRFNFGIWGLIRTNRVGRWRTGRSPSLPKNGRAGAYPYRKADAQERIPTEPWTAFLPRRSLGFPFTFVMFEQGSC